MSRAEEVTAIGAFLTGAAAAPAGLVLEGEAGIGKTTLWLEGKRRAAEAGFVVLSACGSPAEARSTFAAASDLLGEVDAAVLEQLPTVQRAALDRMLLRGAEGPAVEERVVATAFLSVIELLARERPVLVAVDDVQWLDSASRAVVGFAARRLRGRVGVLTTARTGEAPTADIGVWLRLPHPHAMTRLCVGPLSLDAVHEIIADRLGHTLPRIGLVRIHQISGGNPFYALELARALSGQPDQGVELPDSLAELVSRRVGEVDPAAAELLLAIASASDPTVALMARALNVTTQGVADLLDQVETPGIIECRSGRVRFTHPLLAHGVYSRASAHRRRKVHRGLAAAVDDPELCARHLALAATSADTDTIESLDAAAEIAINRGAPGSAAELIELAVGLGGDTALRRIRAAELYFRAGAMEAARRVLPPKVETVPEGPLRCLALMLTGAMRAYDDDLVSAVEVMALAFDEASDNLALRSLCAMRLALGLYMIGKLREAVDHAKTAVDLANRLGVPALRSQALAFWVTASFGYGLGVDHESLRTAVELEDPNSDAVTWFRAGAVQAMLSAWTGDLELARNQLSVVWQHMRDGGTELDIIWAANHMSMVDVWLGRYDDAGIAAREAVQRADQMGARQLLLTAWNVHAEVAARTGNEADARSTAAAAIAAAQATGARQLAVAPTATLAFLEVSLGNYGAALEVLQPLLAVFDAEHGTEIVSGSYLPDAIEALVAVGRLDDAEPLVMALEEHGVRRDRVWMRAVGARGRAQLCAARGQLEMAEQYLRQALREHHLLPMPFERARTGLLLGQVQRRRRSRTAAADTLTAALHTFEQLGSPLWAARARTELQRTRIGPGDRWSLTDTERRTAELAAEGLSNKEIAAELFQSAKTVEMNLTRVYRKLGIRSRAQLAVRFAAGEGSRES